MRFLFTDIRIARNSDDDTPRTEVRVGANATSLSKGLDLTLTLVVMTGLGWVLDRWLGWFPVLTISLLVLGAIGAFAHLKITYDDAMDRLERERHERNSGDGPRIEEAA